MSFYRTSFCALRRIVLNENIINGNPQAISKRNAGHSHWQNTRHIKAAKDANKAKQTDRHVRIIQVAVQNGGGPDVKFNKMLADAIEQAKKTQVVSNAAIEAAIKRAAEPGARSENMKTVLQEFIVDPGLLIIAKCEVSNISQFRNTLKQILKRNPQWGAFKGAKDHFEEKGFVHVSGRQDGGTIDSDDALMFGIEGGAEEMFTLGDGHLLIHEFICAAGQHFGLMKKLQEGGYSISDVGTKFIPMVPLTPDEEALTRLSAFCDELEELPEVVAVYTNVA